MKNEFFMNQMALIVIITTICFFVLLLKLVWHFDEHTFKLFLTDIVVWCMAALILRFGR